MEHSNTYDIAVIGGGPAGLLAALHASERGSRVCLIDRKETPGAPVRCGEAIGLKGFTSCVSLRKEWIKSSVQNTKLVSPSGTTITLPHDYESYIIDRERMERDLTESAVAGGVAFAPRTTITSVRLTGAHHYQCRAASGKIYHAKCVILAEGVESRLARGLGWKTFVRPRDVIACAFARVRHESIQNDACVFFLGQYIAPGGYVWAFPRGGQWANVGLGVIGSLCSSGLPSELLRRFIKSKFPGAETTDLHCGGVPMCRWVKPLVKGGVMLVGDAARQVNCTTGAGIAYALFAGKSAGIAANEACGGDRCDYSALKKYEKEWASHYGKQQRRSYALKETMIGFSDYFLDDVAASLVKEDMAKMNVMKIFMKAFSKHPLQLLKVMRLFK